MSRRSRALALLGVASVCAGLASSIVTRYARDVRAQVGPLAPVLVTRGQVPRGKLFTPANVSRLLSARRVPTRFVPPHSLRFTRDVVGLRALAPIPTGSYVSEGQLGLRGRAGPQADSLDEGRVVEVPVAGAAAIQGTLRAGARVDVLITSERGPGAPRTYLALQRIQLVGFRPGAAAESGAVDGVESLATLRVTLRQAVLLTAAQNFARELRLVPRGSDEVRRLPPTAVSAEDLHP